MSIRKAIYEHLKTKKKYNTLEVHYEEAIRLYEERTRERDAQIEINKLQKKKFSEEIDKLFKKEIELKQEIKELKKRRK